MIGLGLGLGLGLGFVDVNQIWMVCVLQVMKECIVWYEWLQVVCIDVFDEIGMHGYY